MRLQRLDKYVRCVYTPKVNAVRRGASGEASVFDHSIFFAFRATFRG